MEVLIKQRRTDGWDGDASAAKLPYGRLSYTMLGPTMDNCWPDEWRGGQRSYFRQSATAAHVLQLLACVGVQRTYTLEIDQLG